MTKAVPPDDNSVDDGVDSQISLYLNLESPKSFFLFAGAGSGKTRSLVNTLLSVKKEYESQFRIKGIQVGVITYTNAACDEIVRRLDYSPIFHVSTIHSFIWSLIQGFNHDIRAWLIANVTEDINQLQAEQKKGKPGTKAAIERQRSIEAGVARLDLLPSIRKFIYSPTGENRTRDSLNHSEVIKIGASFLTSKGVMQELLISRFPFLLIDECQDTHKLLVDAFFAVQVKFKNRFCLGLFGDTMQRIFSDGKIDLGQGLSADWEKPAKIMNHRSPLRVVKLINKIRADADKLGQRPRTDAKEGVVRLFLANSSTSNKSKIEDLVRKKMGELTGDGKWPIENEVKILILEHHMAARRLNFEGIYKSLHQIESFRTGVRDGSLPALRFFSDQVLPIVSTTQQGKHFAATSTIRRFSPLLTKQAFMDAGEDQMKQVRLAKKGLDLLMRLFAEGKDPRFMDVLICIAENKLLEIPESLIPFVSKIEAPADGDDSKEAYSLRLSAISNFLATNFSQIVNYSSYVKGTSRFATHQGVKGLQFPRVLVVMDDEEAEGFLFSYEKLFGVKAKTQADIKNELEGNETGIDRTRRLFYVTCSRSQESLALVAYSTNPKNAAAYAVERGWFLPEEIVDLS